MQIVLHTEQAFSPSYGILSSFSYYTSLNSLFLFLLAESVQWILEISACDVICHVKGIQGHG